jgi:hypothetical protein
MSTYLPFIPSILPPVNYLFLFNTSPLYLSPCVHFASLLHNVRLFKLYLTAYTPLPCLLSNISPVYLEPCLPSRLFPVYLPISLLSFFPYFIFSLSTFFLLTLAQFTPPLFHVYFPDLPVFLPTFSLSIPSFLSILFTYPPLPCLPSHLASVYLPTFSLLLYLFTSPPLHLATCLLCHEYEPVSKRFRNAMIQRLRSKKAANPPPNPSPPPTPKPVPEGCKST